jgi:hypothetical protein
MGDQRVRGCCKFSVEKLLKQRVYSLALGYEDLNDHLQLRHDVTN